MSHRLQVSSFQGRSGTSATPLKTRKNRYHTDCKLPRSLGVSEIFLRTRMNGCRGVCKFSGSSGVLPGSNSRTSRTQISFQSADKELGVKHAPLPDATFVQRIHKSGWPSEAHLSHRSHHTSQVSKAYLATAIHARFK